MQNTQELMHLLDIEKTDNYGNNCDNEYIFECTADCGAVNGSGTFFVVGGMKICKSCMIEDAREYLAKVCKNADNKSLFFDMLCGIIDDLSNDDIFVHLCECFDRVRND